LELGLVGDAKSKQGGTSGGGQDDSGVGVPGQGLGAVKPETEGVEQDLLEGKTAMGREGQGRGMIAPFSGGSMVTAWRAGGVAFEEGDDAKCGDLLDHTLQAG
jgi:hypothetical protein